METLIRWLNGAIIQWICAIAVSLPFFMLAVNAVRQQKQQVNLRAPLQLALFFGVSLALTRLEPLWPFNEKLWQAMLLEAVWALIFIFATRAITRVGVTLRISFAAWRDSLVVTGGLLLFVMARSLALKFTGLGPGADSPPGLEFLLFQLTMPGLAEELTYRGVIQPGLNEVLGRPWRLLGTTVGWGWVITSALFWAPHAFRIDPQAHLSFYWPTLTMQLWVGLALGWLRERSGSIIPAIIAHNLVNICWSLS